jgi:DGQHR domain-containing protein
VISVVEPTADCQREIVRALVNIAEGRGTSAGTLIEFPLRSGLSEYQWDRCWWNARWWARNEDRQTYEIFRVAGKGCPIVVDDEGARIALEARYPDLVKATLEPSASRDVVTDRGPLVRPMRNSDPRDDLRVRAIRFEQNNRVFYSVVVPAGDIIPRAIVDEWTAEAADDEAGYQRAPMATRLRSVANYMGEPEAVMPVGGLLNARAGTGGAYGSVLKFEADEGQEGPIQSGWLTVPSAVVPVYIVDMQHRLLGIRKAIEEDGMEDLEDFPVALTLADGLSRLEEIEQFELINTTQKKVRTDLARRLMSIQMVDPDTALKYDQKGRKWEARGPKIADWLNHNSVVWRDGIMPPNKTKKDMPTALAKETSFVTSLKPILQTPVFQRTDDEHVAIFLDRYWQAVSKIWPSAFRDPANHVIHKTAGVYSLHMVMPELVELVRETHGMDLKSVLTVDNFLETMEPWRDGLPTDFWARDPEEEGAAQYGTGMGAFGRLAATLRSRLGLIG